MREVLVDLGRLLTFRLSAERWDQLGNRHLVIGLIFTWLAGIGRNWDAPRAEWWQFAGLASLAYVFVLTGILWVVLWPLVAREHLSARRLLTFICLTSPPALLYAIPVEKFMSLNAAITANMWFLGAVALWRVALLAVYLMRGFRLKGFHAFVGATLPITAIITALVLLNLDHVVLNIMGGLREQDRSPADGAYGLLILMEVVALPLFVVTALIWLVKLGQKALRLRRL